MKYIIGPYQLDIDPERTQLFYAMLDNTLGCNCAGCRNYEKAISALPATVHHFLSQFGIQPEKPAEMSAVYAQDEQQLLYDGFFHICGQIPDEIDLWIPTGPNGRQLNPDYLMSLTEDCSAYFSGDCALLDAGFPRPAIQLHISFTLPWLLDEPNPYMFAKK